MKHIVLIKTYTCKEKDSSGTNVFNKDIYVQTKMLVRRLEGLYKGKGVHKVKPMTF